MPLRQSTARPSSHVGAALAAVVATALLAQATTVVAKEVPPPRPSAAECSARADRAARDRVGVAGGAVRGSVGGAAVGAIVRGGKGAKTGAAVGAVVGGTAGAVNREDTYKRVYDDCMRGY